jgi:hypothetical protein
MQAALCHGVVPTVALATPTRLPPGRRQAWLRARSPLRTATVGLHADPHSGLALTARQRPGLGHARCPPLVGHGPPAHGSRTQLQHCGELSPACARRQGGPLSDVNLIWGVPSARPVPWVWGHRLRLPCGLGGFAWAPRLAAQARRGQPAPAAATAARQAVLRHQRLDTARAVGAPPLRTRARYLVLHLLIDLRLRPGGAAAPLVVAPARDLQELTPATPRALGLLLGQPGVLHGSCGAKDAAALCTISRSSCKWAFAVRRRLRSSDRCASWPSCSWRSTR